MTGTSAKQNVLEHTRVVELATITKSGRVSIRPVSAVWSSENEIVMTTPIAYSQKAADIRADPRIAVLYSDFTDSGLEVGEALLALGEAHVDPDVVPPQDIAEYWHTLVRRNPEIADETLDVDHRIHMDWYYWRLVIRLRPQSLQWVKNATAGGTTDLPPDQASMTQLIADALQRYPSAVLGARTADGSPRLVRATASRADEGLLLRPADAFPAQPGQSSLLWHRFGGPAGVMSSISVSGNAEPTSAGWQFTPQRLAPSLSASTTDEWITDGKARSAAFLQRHDITAPQVDWSVFTAEHDQA